MDPHSTDLRHALLGRSFTIPSSIGPLTLGLVDVTWPAVAAAISGLLVRSINDARESRGGHLPDWLVEDIQRNYISPARVQTLWAPFGHRFGLLHDSEIIGTIHITRDHDTIFTVNRDLNNVSSREYPGFKPERYHHVVNLSVKHEVRRSRVATAMLEGIEAHFRDLFDGDGLWMRADPPWHPSLAGLGFHHDPSMDIFLPAEVVRTAGLAHGDFNAQFACGCRPVSPLRPDAMAARPAAMQEKKLQYLSFSRPFALRDWGRVARARPLLLTRPRDAEEVGQVLRDAGSSGARVAVRGRGHSVEGQSLVEGGVILSTERLGRIGEPQEDHVTVGAGVPWDALVEALAPRGLYPPVLTGWLPATIGGTLATAGFSKGSHRHGLQIDHVLELVLVTGEGRRVVCSAQQEPWLFEAALGGLGRFGVIVEATLRLCRYPAWVEIERTQALDLVSALDRAAADPLAFHVTSFLDPTLAAGGRWVMVTARLREQDTGGCVPLARYVRPPRPQEPPGPALWLNVFVPPAGLAPLLDACAQVLEPEAGDALQVIPIRKLGERRGSLYRSAAVPVGGLFHGVCLTRELRGRDPAALAAQHQALLATARGLAGASYLTAMVPRTEAEWRAHLGEDLERLQEHQRLADPHGVLGRLG